MCRLVEWKPHLTLVATRIISLPMEKWMLTNRIPNHSAGLSTIRRAEMERGRQIEDLKQM